MKHFKDKYVMYQLLEFIDENSIIALCKANKKLSEICRQYIELEDDRRFGIILSNDKYDYSQLLEEYCINNDIIKIRIMIKMKLHWNYGLYDVCEVINIDIIKLMIKKGAWDWNYGLECACYGGHIDIAKFMIEKGAYNWNWGLEGACQGGHMDCVNFMIEKGATSCANCEKTMEEHLTKSE